MLISRIANPDCIADRAGMKERLAKALRCRAWRGHHDKRPRCDHEAILVTKIIAINGTPVIGIRCLQCGAQLDNQLGHRLVHRERMPVYKGELNDLYLAKIEERRQAEKDFWERYRAHLKTDKWRDLSQRTEERERGVCQRCGERGRHAHHITYERMGDEDLSDLEWLCVACHELEHDRQFSGSTNRYWPVQGSSGTVGLVQLVYDFKRGLAWFEATVFDESGGYCLGSFNSLREAKEALLKPRPRGVD